jgi:hypothetical protein
MIEQVFHGPAAYGAGAEIQRDGAGAMVTTTRRPTSC